MASSTYEMKFSLNAIVFLLKEIEFAIVRVCWIKNKIAMKGKTMAST